MQNSPASYSSQTPIFPNFHLFFQNFALCFLPPIFQKNLLAKSVQPYTLIRVCHKDYNVSLDYGAHYGFHIVYRNDLARYYHSGCAVFIWLTAIGF